MNRKYIFVNLELGLPMKDEALEKIIEAIGNEGDTGRMWFNEDEKYTYGLKDANAIAKFLEKHHSTGECRDPLEDMIAEYAMQYDYRLSEAIELYESKEIEPEFLEEYGLKYED